MQLTFPRFHPWVEYNNVVVRLQREFPQLEAVLKEPPCAYCFEVINVNGHCDVTVCPKLEAWLMALARGGV